ncbi:N-acetyltransferase [Simplicispira suum]|uniref:N-acetyltransferase n=2 Tax=Simplicispira suum TaxID=2109915 RepID=A0A2S0MVV7_9BURK|nr:N-acetyltransferase [Simplicispira suum]
MKRLQPSPHRAGDGLAFGITEVGSGAQRVAAAVLLADAMRDNPLHVQAFGADPARRRQRLFRFMEALVRHVQSHGTLLGAYAQGELVGVLGMMKPGCCRPTGWAALRFAAVIMTSNPPVGAVRIGRWLAAWARNDPSGFHWHIGPLAVASAYRRQGVGRHLMVHCCGQMDALAAVAWLETDLAINARFYESLGFVTAQHEPVLGVPNWFMRRAPVEGGDQPA